MIPKISQQCYRSNYVVPLYRIMRGLMNCWYVRRVIHTIYHGNVLSADNPRNRSLLLS